MTGTNVTNKTLVVNVTSGTPIPQLTYDADGNLSNEVTTSGTVSYTWDAANRLIAITEPNGSSSQFAYDGLGRRVRITESGTNGAVTSVKNLIWDGMTIREERNASNAVTKLYFNNGVQISGSNYYYTRDHLGSIREVTDGNENVQSRYAYDPYGQQTQVSGTMSADFGFTGLYVHKPSGLLLAPHREYLASLGRWMSRDPLGERGGVNMYAYVLNHPVNYTDPLGTSPLGDLYNGWNIVTQAWSEIAGDAPSIAAAGTLGDFIGFGLDALENGGDIYGGVLGYLGYVNEINQLSNNVFGPDFGPGGGGNGGGSHNGDSNSCHHGGPHQCPPGEHLVERTNGFEGYRRGAVHPADAAPSGVKWYCSKY